ncbi:MAG TPA: thioredoxin domain-containing protein [Ignavibacteria bacterium]|nr:thioredoxin domain-containing protein [Ignavibacteria bacterium]HMR39906.1 thioredoxin domain-containing protein [Ignavibacteria bacterium]
MKNNKLINEKSPYLLQHAHNPVDWHPWNEETFRLAKKVNKPIFLSIGYSACYWCYVMEREVFENEEIAKMMNEYFVNVKVDREERPDVDRVYMTALQAMTGSGGWPMSMFLTPDLKPFYGATYVPPKAKYGRAGFEDVITQIHDVWKNKEKEVIESGDKIVDRLNEFIEARSAKESELSEATLENAFINIKKIYDEEYGGFGSGNKFPRPVVFNFLLGYYYHTRDFSSLDMVSYSLKKMYEGGMYDHLSGGFHRYSVDNIWRVPHFEKMLYDQAQLVTTYVNTYLVTKNKFYLFVAEDTAQYVLENLMNKEGGFFSAEDAESALDHDKPGAKAEGAYYLWEKEELEEILTKDEAEIFNFFYGIQNMGNTLNDPHEVFGKKNVLFIANDIFDTAKQFGKNPEDIAEIIDECRSKLLRERIKRPKPGLDDKILTSWNGLMISGLANLFKVTNNDQFLLAGSKAVDFIKDKLYKNNELLHRYRDGESKYDGTLEDYAYLINGLLDLYEASFEVEYLEFAIELNRSAIGKFYDNDNSGFFDVAENTEDVILKTKDSYDGAEPAGNSIQIMNLLRIGYMTDNKDHIEKAEKSLKLFSPELDRLPFSSPQMLCSLSFVLNSPKEIIITGDKKNEKTLELVKCVNEMFIPDKVVMNSSEEFIQLAPFVGKLITDITDSKVYVCENYQCNLPVDDIEKLKELLK